MVDTLVLGTSAKAWEFESLHAQITKKEVIRPLFLLSRVFSSEKLLLEFERPVSRVVFYCPVWSEVKSKTVMLNKPSRG